MIRLSIVTQPQFAVSFSKLMDAPLPGRHILCLKRAWKKLDDEMRLYEETRKLLCSRAATKDEAGNPVIQEGNYDIPPSALPALTAEIAKLQETTIDLGPALPFEVAELAKLTAKDLLALEGLIEEPTE